MAMRMKLEFEDSVSRKLQKLAVKSPSAFMNALQQIALETKTYVVSRQKREFVSKSRTLEKGTRYQKRGTSVKLQMRPRYQVLEFGAYIKPDNKKVLRFIGKDGEVVYTKHARILPRPFFKPGVKDAIRADVVNKVAERVYETEMRKLGLK